MDVFEAIYSRRSIGKVKDILPSKELIEKILDAGRWSPNHYKTEPWRFTVLTGQGRMKLAEAYSEIELESGNYTEDEENVIREKSKRKAFRAPVIIVVKVEPSSLPHVEMIEEIEACACAVQNMLLTTHALGLGAIWRTGKPTYHPLMKKQFGVSKDGLVTGFLYIGYPTIEPKQPIRKPLSEIATWIEE